MSNEMAHEGASQKKPGVFITFEGGDGAGKSTHLFLVSEALRDRGYDVECMREPGGTIIGEQLRNIILDPANYLMSKECELLMYEAARAQLVFQSIHPALQRGAVVLCDRFIDSTVAYQAYGRGLNYDYVVQSNNFVCQGIMPDRTILMMTSGGAEVALDRATQHKHADRMEMAGVAFHSDVADAYLELAGQDPARIRVVVSDDSKVQTARKVFNELSDFFPWMADTQECSDDYFEELISRRI